MPSRKVEAPILSSLVGQGTPIKDGVWQGPIFSSFGHARAYLKLLDARRMLVECVAALVGRAHDLPIPRPHLVWAASHQLPGCPVFEGWIFGSEDGSSPSLSRLARGRDEVERRIKSWSRASEAGAFDTWIGNADRTSKNLLWADDNTRVQLIDHDDALPDWLDAGGETANEIMRVLCDGTDEFSQRRHHRSALKAIEHYAHSDWTDRTAWATHFTDEQHLLDLVAFLTQRLQHLPQLLAIASGTARQMPIWPTTSPA